MPKDAEITRIEFEGPRLAIYVKNVGLLAEQSYVVTEIVHLLHTESEERSRILRDVGERIFRPTFSKAGYVRLVTLGAFHEVGRAAMLIQAGSSSILLDSGINPGAQDPASAYPRFDTDEFDLEKLDAVVISRSED